MLGLKRLTRQDFICFSVFIILLLVFFGRLFFTDATLYARDISHYYRPMCFLSAESIQRGIFPFWNPYVSCGQPFLAVLQHGLLYPVSLITFLFPFETAFKFVFIIPFILAGLGIYLLLRSFQLSPAAGLSAVVLFCFGGVMTSLVTLLTTLTAAGWLSFVCLFFIKAQSQKKWFGWALLAALGLALEFFAGQPEIVYLSVLVLLIFSLLANPRHYLASAKILGMIVSLTVLFILLELLPFWQLLKLSSRETFSTWEAQTYWSLSPGQLLDVFSAWFNRPEAADHQEWLSNLFFGGGGIFLAGYGLFSGKLKKPWSAIMIVTILGLFLAFGKYTFFYQAMVKLLPGLKAIRYPVKFYFLFNWGLVLLAAAGWSRWFQSPVADKQDRTRIPWPVSGILFVSAGTILLLGYGFLSWPVLFLDAGLLSAFIGGLCLFRWPAKWQGYGQAGLIAILFYSSAIHTYNTEKLVPITAIKHHGTFKKQLDTLAYERYAFTPKTYAVLTGSAQDTKNFAVKYNQNDLSLWESVPNMAMIGHEFVARGYESIYLNNYYSFYSLISFQPSPGSSQIMDLLGIKYLVSIWDLTDQKYDLVKQNVWQIYLNKNVFPRVFLTNNNVQAVDLTSAMHKIKEDIVYETTAKIIKYDLNEVVIEAASDRNSTLVLTDTYYPGWQAAIDGRAAAIFPAYYMMRGISVPPGKHTVVFEYLPANFRWAALVTVGAYLLSLFCLVNWARTKID